MRYGKQKRLILLYGRTCRARFSEPRDTALFHARLSENKLEAVLAHLQEGGCGVRETARLTGVHPETVTRSSRLEGQPSKDLHDEGGFPL